VLVGSLGTLLVISPFRAFLAVGASCSEVVPDSDKTACLELVLGIDEAAVYLAVVKSAFVEGTPMTHCA
jgi:hypothetical protein